MTMSGSIQIGKQFCCRWFSITSKKIITCEFIWKAQKHFLRFYYFPNWVWSWPIYWPFFVLSEGKPKTNYSTGLGSRLWIFRGSAGPQPLRISLSLAMAEFSVKKCALNMWCRVFGARSQICYLTGQYIGLGVKQSRNLPSLKWLSCWKLLWKWCILAVGIFIYYQDDAY